MKVEKIMTGDYIAVVCRVIADDIGPYPNMHNLMPITDDNIEFLACEKAIIGKVNFTKEKGYHIAEESFVGECPECETNLGGEQ